MYGFNIKRNERNDTMKIRITLSMLIGLLCLLTLGLQGVDAQANDFYAVIANLTNVKTPQASIDVAFDTRCASAGTDILFSVFRGADGVFLGEFTLLLNANGFLSSASAASPNDNLFTVSASQPALVRLRAPTGCTYESAILRQALKAGLFAVGIPPAFDVTGSRVAIGRLFSVPLRDVPPRTTLLIANVSGADVTVDIFLGTAGPIGTGNPSNPRLKNNAVWIVDIDPAYAHSHLVLSSTGDIVAQLAVDTGKETISEVTLVPFH